MPVGRVVTIANGSLAGSSLAEQHPDLVERLSAPGSLGEVAQRLLDLTDDERAYIDAIPASVQEGIRASIVSGVSRGLDVHLQFSPAYDFSTQVWEYGTAVSVHISGPYTGSDFPRVGFSDA